MTVKPRAKSSDFIRCMELFFGEGINMGCLIGKLDCVCFSKTATLEEIDRFNVFNIRLGKHFPLWILGEIEVQEGLNNSSS